MGHEDPTNEFQKGYFYTRLRISSLHVISSYGSKYNAILKEQKEAYETTHEESTWARNNALL